MVISIIEPGGGDRRKPGTKLICVDQYNNTFEVDQLEDSKFQKGECFLRLDVMSEECAKMIIRLGKRLSEENTLSPNLGDYENNDLVSEPEEFEY